MEQDGWSDGSFILGRAGQGTEGVLGVLGSQGRTYRVTSPHMNVDMIGTLSATLKILRGVWGGTGGVGVGDEEQSCGGGVGKEQLSATPLVPSHCPGETPLGAGQGGTSFSLSFPPPPIPQGSLKIS